MIHQQTLRGSVPHCLQVGRKKTGLCANSGPLGYQRFLNMDDVQNNYKDERRKYVKDSKKLVIQTHKYTEPSMVVSLRLPKDMLADIDKVAAVSGRSRNEILLMSLEYALGNLEIQTSEETDVET